MLCGCKLNPSVTGNVAVNAMLLILLADMTSGMSTSRIEIDRFKMASVAGLMGFFPSTALIVIFGEIMPQAACSRYGLGQCTSVSSATIFSASLASVPRSKCAAPALITY